MLFTHTHTNTHTDLIGAVIVWFILAVLYEGLKTLREYLIYVDMKHWKKHNGRKCVTTSGLNDKTSLIVSEEHHGKQNKG